MNNNFSKEFLENYIKSKEHYDTIIRKQKEDREKYNLIDTGKEIIENFNTKLLPNFNNYKDKYINVELKFFRIITTLDFVNSHLVESNKLWEKLTRDKNTVLQDTDLMMFNTFSFIKLFKVNEYIIYDLRTVIDEIISIVSVIKGKINRDKIEISSIGNYLDKHDSTFNEFDDFCDFFATLNNISNAYKHSYANSDFPALGRNENCFTALYSKYNNFSDNVDIYCVSVNQIVDEFNKFYKQTYIIIDNLTKNTSKK